MGRYAVHFHFDDRLVVGGLHEDHALSLARGRSEVAAISKVLTFDAAAPGADGGSSLGKVCMVFIMYQLSMIHVVCMYMGVHE